MKNELIDPKKVGHACAVWIDTQSQNCGTAKSLEDRIFQINNNTRTYKDRYVVIIENRIVELNAKDEATFKAIKFDGFSQEVVFLCTDMIKIHKLTALISQLTGLDAYVGIKGKPKDKAIDDFMSITEQTVKRRKKR